MIVRKEKLPYANLKLWEIVEKETDGNISKFSEMIGLSPQRINRLFFEDKRSGNYPKVSDEVRMATIETFELKPDYFMLPANELEVNPLEDLKDEFNKLPEDNMISLAPHIPTKAAAGGTGGVSDCIMRRDCEFRPVVKMIPKYDMTMDVKGDSMVPKYENGDIVAIRKVVDVIEWGNVYVLDTADGVVIKRLYNDGDKFRCVSYNKEYDDFTVEKSNVYGVYKVVGLIRL